MKNELEIYLAVFSDGEYLTIKLVKARSVQSATKKLAQKGWLNPVRFELVEFNNLISTNHFEFH